MSPEFTRVRGASVATFVVYVCGALLALAPAVPFASALERAVSDHPAGSGALYEPGGVWLMEAFAEVGRAGAVLANVTLVALVLSLLLGPLLQMTWLAALLRRQKLAEALAAGAKRYFRAIGISLALSPLLGFAGVSLGQNHSCGLTTTGGVKCWGRNDNGRLGDDTNVQQRAA